MATIAAVVNPCKFSRVMLTIEVVVNAAICAVWSALANVVLIPTTCPVVRPAICQVAKAATCLELRTARLVGVSTGKLMADNCSSVNAATFPVLSPFAWAVVNENI